MTEEPTTDEKPRNVEMIGDPHDPNNTGWLEEGAYCLKEAADYLTNRGVPTSPLELEELSKSLVGPSSIELSGFTLYPKSDLQWWADVKLDQATIEAPPPARFNTRRKGSRVGRRKSRKTKPRNANDISYSSEAAQAYLTGRGVKIVGGMLERLSDEGRGPTHRMTDGHAFYWRSELDRWADFELGLVCSSREAVK